MDKKKSQKKYIAIMKYQNIKIKPLTTWSFTKTIFRWAYATKSRYFAFYRGVIVFTSPQEVTATMF